jgi:hypothetical protein
MMLWAYMYDADEYVLWYCRFLVWRRVSIHRMRHRVGCYRLNKVWLRVKRRLCFLAWPGRKEIVTATQWKQHLESKHRSNPRHRIRLVDVSDDEDLEGHEVWATKRRSSHSSRWSVPLCCSEQCRLVIYTVSRIRMASSITRLWWKLSCGSGMDGVRKILGLGIWVIFCDW